MIARYLPASLLLASAVLASACLSPKSSDGGDGGSSDGGGDGGGGGATTCADLQQGEVAADSIVTLADVIVTSPLTLEGDGFYVQDPGGGPWSGMYIFLQGNFDGLQLAVGDRVSITGTYSEFYDFSELAVGGMDDIEVLGEGEVTVSPLADMSDMEQWEAVLVDAGAQTFTSCPSSYGEVVTESGLKVNDQLFAADIDRNSSVSSLVGLVEYSFEEFKLNPRDAADLVGFTAGDGCTYTIPEVHDAVDAADARNPKQSPRIAVEVEGVATTGLTESGEAGFFIQQEGGGAKSGMFVFFHEKLDPSSLEIEPGDVVQISGDATVYYGFTELAVYEASDIVEVGTATVATDVFSDAPADWDPWEGALVQILDPIATADTSKYGECPLDIGLVMDDWFVLVEANDGDGWDSITGVITYGYETYGIQPRDLDDLVSD